MAVRSFPAAMDECRLLNGRQVQHMFGIKKTKLWSLTKRKQDPLPSVKLGKSRKYRLDKLLWWLDKQEV